MNMFIVRADKCTKISGIKEWLKDNIMIITIAHNDNLSCTYRESCEAFAIKFHKGLQRQNGVCRRVLRAV